MFKKAYLFAYNAACAVLWAACLVRGAAYLAEHGWEKTTSTHGFYDAVRDALYVGQTLAVMEIVHSALGVVRSPLATSVMQVSSRLLLLWGVADLVPESRAAAGFVVMVLSWSLVEVPRYAFYAMGQVGYVPYPLTWLRYSLFAVLYPSGITGELLTVVNALPFVRERRPWSVSMPNSMNLEFEYFWMLIFVLVIYVPGSPVMYKHMSKQRAKVLGGADAKASKSKKKQ